MSDPEQCLFDNWWYASPASLIEDASLNRSRQAVTTSPDDDEAEVTMLQYGKDSIGPAIEEDVAVFVTQQRGFRSRGFTGVYLSNQEIRIRRYHEMIDEYIEKHVGPVQQ